MTEKTFVEVYVVIDSVGDYTVGVDRDSALETYAEDIGSTDALRVLKLTLKVTPPDQEELEPIDVPDNVGTTDRINVE